MPDPTDPRDPAAGAAPHDVPGEAPSPANPSPTTADTSSSGRTGRALRGPDALMWRTGDADRALRWVVCAVIRMESAPDPQRLRADWQRLSSAYPVLRERPWKGAVGVSPPRMVNDPEFDLDLHLTRMRLPGGGDWDDVLGEARRLTMTDFDHQRPLWRATLIEGLPDGGAALVLVMHHAIADGKAAVMMGASLFTTGPDPRSSGTATADGVTAVPVGGAERPSRPTSATSVTRANIADNVARTASGAAETLRSAVSESARVVRSPLDRLGRAKQMADSLGRLQPERAPERSAVFGQRSDALRVTTAEVPFGSIRRAAHGAGVSVNDIFLTAIATGLAHHHERHGNKVAHLRFAVPISLRADDDKGLGNAVTLAQVLMPINGATVAERLTVAHDKMMAWRREPALGAAASLVSVHWLASIERIAATARENDVAASNVPGPPVPLFLSGSLVTGMWPLVTPVGSAVNITMLTYNGTAFIGIVADDAAVADLVELRADLQRGFDEVLEKFSDRSGPPDVPKD